MSRTRIVITKVLPAFFLGATIIALVGGCTSTSSNPGSYALTGTNSPPAFVPPASTIDSKGHYHPDWYFHGAPRQGPFGQGQ